MPKLTLTIDTIMYPGLEQYLENLEGISKVLIINKTALLLLICILEFIKQFQTI